MHDGVDHIRGPRVIAGVCPPSGPEMKRSEFGGAILIDLYTYFSLVLPRIQPP
jgi:hypothetical protein